LLSLVFLSSARCFVPGGRCLSFGEYIAGSFLFVLEGALIMVIHNHETVLEAGDSIYFDASSEHTFFPADGREAVILEVAFGGN